MNRIASVDVFRGIALLQMIFWQILDFFLIGNIYTDVPYYFQPFNMPINGVGVGLFAFIAGFGVYFSATRRDSNKLASLKYGLKRYGGYVLISFLFTTFVFGFPIFFGWEEVVQGIGLSGIVAFSLLLLTKSKVVLGLISGVLIVFQQTIINFTYQFPVDGFLGFITNFLFRGYFSIISILPFILVGIIACTFFLNKKIKILAGFGVFIFILSLLLHFLGFGINYYSRSLTYMIFYISISFIILAVVDFIIRKDKNFILFKPLKTLGKGAFLGYLLHFLFIYKPSVVLGFNSIFGFYMSLALSIISIVIIYFLVRGWLNLKEKRSWKVLWF